MHDAISLSAPIGRRRLTRLRAHARTQAPTLAEIGLAALSALLLISSFPDFDLWPLAWIGLVPLFVAIARRPRAFSSLMLGWLTGALFFYGSCYWITYAMVRYGHIPAWIAYPLIVPGALVLGLFPAMCGVALARLVARWGVRAIFVAPFLWVALEWVRLGVTGQLWNAIGYSQAYVPALIQAAHWGGVYAVGFLVVTVNATVAYMLLQKSVRAAATAAFIMAGVTAVGLGAYLSSWSDTALKRQGEPVAVVAAVQPDVPMDPVGSAAESIALIERHQSLSESALREWDGRLRQWEANLREIEAARQRKGVDRSRQELTAEDIIPRKSLDKPRIVIWPESPMNFTYARDSGFREMVARFNARNHTLLLFNSLEPAPANGYYNAAVMVNEEGRVVAQYDKIRLLPFGEYVPLPRWLPGVNLIPVMVGDFTPGAQYHLIPLGEARAGVFICFESAFPAIARKFSDDGADVLINISNDGYLGPTPVMRQHLANAVFRAVENGRPVLRVTNTGISAYISPRGEVRDATEGFQPAVRTWTVSRAGGGKTFYTKHGDVFVGACAAISLAVLAFSLKGSFRRGRPALSS